MEFLDPMEAEKFKKQKCIQFCWTTEPVHTPFLNEGHCSADKHFWKSIILFTIGNNLISCYSQT